MLRNSVTGSNTSLIKHGRKCSPYVHQGCTNPGTRFTGRLNFIYFWILSIKLASIYPSGAKNFEFAPRFFEPLTLDVMVFICHAEYLAIVSGNEQ